MEVKIVDFCNAMETLYSSLGINEPIGRGSTRKLRAGFRQCFGVVICDGNQLRFANDHEPRIMAVPDGEWVPLTTCQMMPSTRAEDAVQALEVV